MDKVLLLFETFSITCEELGVSLLKSHKNLWLKFFQNLSFNLLKTSITSLDLFKIGLAIEESQKIRSRMDELFIILTLRIFLLLRSHKLYQIFFHLVLRCFEVEHISGLREVFNEELNLTQI